MSFAPTTPSHALPGAFLHTPAVASRFNAQQQDTVRRRLFREQSTAGSSSNPQPPIFSANPAPGFGFNAPTADDQNMRPPMNPLAPPQSPLAKAASFINQALTKDESYPDLDQYCRRQYPYPFAYAVEIRGC